MENEHPPPHFRVDSGKMPPHLQPVPSRSRRGASDRPSLGRGECPMESNAHQVWRDYLQTVEEHEI